MDDEQAAGPGTGTSVPPTPPASDAPEPGQPKKKFRFPTAFTVLAAVLLLVWIATFFVPAVTALLYPDEQRRVVAAGHEIGIHGWIHERNSELPEKAERDLQMRSADTLEKVSGQRPVGIRTPSWDFSPHTLAITRDMGLIYDSSLMADDDCHELTLDGAVTGVVELPVEWIRDDAVYFNMDRFSTLRPYTPPSGALEIFKAEFDGAYAEGGM